MASSESPSGLNARGKRLLMMDSSEDDAPLSFKRAANTLLHEKRKPLIKKIAAPRRSYNPARGTSSSVSSPNAVPEIVAAEEDRTVTSQMNANLIMASTQPAIPEVTSVKTEDLPAMNTPGETPIEPDDEIRAAFRPCINGTPSANAPASLFSVQERVTFKFKALDNRINVRGVVVKAVAWEPVLGCYYYKLMSDENGTIFQPAYPESDIKTSRHGVGDIVRVLVFGTHTNQAIQKVHVCDSRIFTYEIVAGLRARPEDISGLVARRH